MHTRSGMYGVKHKTGNSKFDGRGKKAKDALVISDNESSENDGSENGCSSNEERVMISSKMMKRKANSVISDNRDEDQTENQVEQLILKKKGKQAVIEKSSSKKKREIVAIEKSVKGKKHLKTVKAKKIVKKKGSSIRGKVRTKNGDPKARYASRLIVLGRTADLEFFDKNGFSNFRSWLSDQSFDKFVKINEVIYPRLVRDFYSNLSVHKNDNLPLLLTTKVNDIDITVDTSLLSEVFSLPIVGYNEYITHKMIQFDGFSRQEAWKMLTNKESVSPKFEPKANKLTLEFKLFYDMLIHVFFPRIGGREYVNNFEIFFMWAVANGKEMSFPHLMLQYMSKVPLKPKGSLPYGMALTRIFKHKGIKVEDESEKKASEHTDIYSVGTLDRFGYERDGNTWVKQAVGAAGKKKLKKSSEAFHNLCPTDLPHSSPQPSNPSSSSMMSNEFMSILMELKREIQEIKETRSSTTAASTSTTPPAVIEELNQLKAELKLLKEKQIIPAPSSSIVSDTDSLSEEF